MANILFNGLTGQVGRAIANLTKEDKANVWTGLSSNECDLTKPNEIEAAFHQYQPDIFIQVAAYTAVDKAEEDIATAFAINEASTAQIAQLCKASGATMIYISSDYVYHSISDRPIKETDPCLPKGEYAKSKYAGEQAIRETLDQHIILRTSWVYDKDGHNFVNTMKRLGGSRDSLTIVSDQLGAPTYAPDIATTILIIVDHLLLSEEKTALYGTYNFSNNGVTNWADFAREIFRIENIPCTVSEQTTEEFGAPAPRPKWSVLSHAKLNTTFGIKPRSWQECLKECLS